MKAITGAKLILTDRVLEDHVIIFSDKIEQIVAAADFSKGALEVIEMEGYVCPGFIDIHIHGAGGADAMDGTAEALATIARSIVKSGTTSFLATTMTMDQTAILKALEAARIFQRLQQTGEKGGAALLGVHLEGPFINPAYKGAQDPQFVMKPSASWWEGYGELVRMITLAPEMDEDFAFIKAMQDRQIILSIGHSGCDFETACAAFDAGVTHVTHCFNAMPGLHHRKPGIIGAVMAKPFTIDIISDGVHIQPGFIGPFLQLRPVERNILITDSIRANYLQEGDYDLGGQSVRVEDGQCRLADGTIAGSVHKMDDGLRNLLRDTTYPVYDIIRMMTENPARELGIFDEVGSIADGKRADLVLLGPDFKVRQVYVKGELCHDGGRA